MKAENLLSHLAAFVSSKYFNSLLISLHSVDRSFNLFMSIVFCWFINSRICSISACFYVWCKIQLSSAKLILQSQPYKIVTIIMC